MAYVNQNFITPGTLYLTSDGSIVLNVTDFSFDQSKDKTDQQYFGSSITYPIYGVKTVTGSFSSHQVFSNDLSTNEISYDYFDDKFNNGNEVTFLFKTTKSGSKYKGGKAKVDSLSLSGSSGSTPNSWSAQLTFTDVSTYTA